MKKNNLNAIKNYGQWVFYFTMIAIPVLHFIFFYIGVNFNSILLAFEEYDYETGSYFISGFQNFSKVFSSMVDSSVMGNAYRNTIIVRLVMWVIRMPLAWVFSWYIYKKNPGSLVFRVILYLPAIISSVTLVTMYRFFVEMAVPEIINSIFGTEIMGLLANPDTTFGTIMFYHIWSSFGGTILIYSGTMGNISDSIIEAAKVDGITPYKEFSKIVIPIIWPTIATFLVVGVAELFINQMDLFTFYDTHADPSNYTVGYFLFMSIKKANRSNYPFLAAYGIVLTFITIPLVFLARWITGKLDKMEN